MIPPFFAWVPLACLGAALVFIAIRSRKARERQEGKR